MSVEQVARIAYMAGAILVVTGTLRHRTTPLRYGIALGMVAGGVLAVMSLLR